MRIDYIQPILNLQCFYDFAKLDRARQEEILSQEGLFLDLDSEKNTITRLYFLKGFFVEEVISKVNDEVIDIIPYKQGYRLERFLEVKQNPLPAKSSRLQWCMN